MEYIISLLALVGMGYGVFRGFKLMANTGRLQVQRAEQLTPNDLKVLEESAERLMADLRAVTDECVARIELACAQAQGIVCQSPSITSEIPKQAPAAWSPLASSGFSTVPGKDESSLDYNLESGMTAGEIELMRGLKAMDGRR